MMRTRRGFLQSATVSAVALATGMSSASPLALSAGDGADGKPTVRKKGVCGGIHGEKGLRALTAAWFYSWGVSSKMKVEGIEWLPQIFPHAKDKEDIPAACRRAKESGSSTLLGYNEPDHPGQGDITVEQAVAWWPQLMESGMRLVGPATTWAPNRWMKDFMKEARKRKFRIDATAIHWYGAPDADDFLRYVRAAHQDYESPVWVTEFAPTDKHASKERPSTMSVKDVVRFYREVLPELEKLPWLERYCIYGPHHAADAKMGSACLFAEDGTLSEVGAFIASV